MAIDMTEAERWIAHYTRLLAGSLSKSERAWAMAELRRWQQRKAA